MGILGVIEISSAVSLCCFRTLRTGESSGSTSRRRLRKEEKRSLVEGERRSRIPLRVGEGDSSVSEIVIREEFIEETSG